ncbi:MAG: hypothetical protein ACK4TR_02835, partial [Phenylobacterium sp.]|uniref:hypothetical protein n=1 Tax=Phenylobacterium sp. TaxID=1871053 RepID=UPI00391C809E
MTFVTSLLTGTAIALSCVALASAQTIPEPADDPALDPALDEEGYEVRELVVTASGQRVLPGSVVGEAVPEVTLDPAEIRALGVSSVEELLAALGPQVSSGRGRGGGRPVVLLNGVRVSSFREVRDIPPEAILRVEVLPEEVSLRYGYPADQRVVNFVLRRRFNALTTETDWSVPTAGGQSTQELEAQVLRLAGDSRTQVNIELENASSLLESERDVARTDGQDGALRTLSPASRSLEVNAVYARPLAEGVAASLNAAFETSDTESRLGPSDNPDLAAGELDPLRRMNDASTAHLGGAVNGAVSGWRWSLTANADRETSRSLTEVAYDATGAAQAPTRSRSTTTSADIEALLNGGLFDLPAGEVNAALTLGASTLKLEGESFRAGVTRDTDLGRDLGRAQLNLDAPLLDGGAGPLALVGKVSANLNAEVRELSDFGTLTTVGGGLTWSPIDQVRLIASVTDEDGAPTVSQLGAPETVTPGVRVFDFTRGETVEVTQISGGNPNLSADNRQVLKLGLTLKPLDDIDLMLRADYTRQRLTDEIASFPAATAEIEAAFPDRFVRDATGQLIRIDNRAVNFARHDTEELRWGFHYSRRLSGPTAAQGAGQPAARAAAGPPPEGPPPEGPPQEARAGGGGASGGPS